MDAQLALLRYYAGTLRQDLLQSELYTMRFGRPLHPLRRKRNGFFTKVPRNIQFDDTIMPGSVAFRGISYVEVLRFMWECARHKDGRYFTEKNWLDPVYIGVHGLTHPDNATFREYALWCNGNLGRFRSTTASEKRIPLYPIVVAITTKFWSSFIALFSTIVAIKKQFSVGDNSVACGWFDLIEYSFKTFVNAGFTDVKPLKPIARILTVMEAMLGYLSLGALIFLLNKRIELMRSH
ncbi:hypothetical protein [Burkholderia ambifaria]|uniref:hypothetical protein n=1 Tax=Burkholderia ambifaria TaxID=152480 RepID=UPI001588AF09|nr:hypothetical protein [Burkholderia ambifaria]WDR86120.1 hypothetical protein OR986_06800 [Burkholderia ambifaria]WDR98752.1 hypothetical protein OR985_11760 [Burkholderia ambifaria]